MAKLLNLGDVADEGDRGHVAVIVALLHLSVPSSEHRLLRNNRRYLELSPISAHPVCSPRL